MVYYNLEYENNAKILLEWVYFHMMQGVGHFYFYYFQLTTAQKGFRRRLGRAGPGARIRIRADDNYTGSYWHEDEGNGDEGGEDDEYGNRASLFDGQHRRLGTEGIKVLAAELAKVPDLKRFTGGRLLLELEAKGLATLVHWEQTRACDPFTIGLRWGKHANRPFVGGADGHFEDQSINMPDCTLVDDVQV